MMTGGRKGFVGGVGGSDTGFMMFGFPSPGSKQIGGGITETSLRLGCDLATPWFGGR